MSELLLVLQAANTLLAFARELGVGYAELAAVMERADREGREVTVDDLEPLRTRSDETRRQLVEAIERARREGR